MEEITLPVKREDTPRVTRDKVASAVRKMGAGKRPEKDEIKAEHLKAGCYFFLKAVAGRFTIKLSLLTVPSAWLASERVVLKKKGDPEGLENYRPISLLPQLCKLFIRVLSNRKSRMEISRKQGGFRGGYCTDDRIPVLGQLLEKIKNIESQYFSPLLTSVKHSTR